MKFLSDSVMNRLQQEAQLPDLTGTRYRPLSFLGSGGMGVVWLAEDTVLARRVAIKLLGRNGNSSELEARLLREAAVLARLEHPGIVPVHDAGKLPDGTAYYCMKFVEGKDLARHIEGASLRDRLLLFQRIADTLAFAHSRGVLHRDLKPGNVMVGAFGEVLIMDWGLAKQVHGPAPQQLAQATSVDAAERAAQPRIATGHGAVLGTPGFMAPEQERGEIELLDERTDVYGLGALLEFMLSDTKPARPLLAICRKATATGPSDRYASVNEMAADVGRYSEGMPVLAYPENLLEKTARLVSRHRIAVVLVMAYLLMRMLFLIFSRR